ncbi:Glyoxalase/bleomycin resistance protein/dioxygenase-like protein [Thermothelomyces heterothallicus CBS 202.75]|uniref:Glyoxalase/bleomycin resistance protein/dioxygenase-like protein n=1 Tax=Thermothelomyces heterothallicus CBS 202.75 TaxID=1149848 RepID=UPI0037425515
MTIAHTGIKVPAAQYPAVVAWYEAALAPLGYKKSVVLRDGNVVGFSDNAAGIADWWVASSAAAPEPVSPPEGAFVPNHTCFLAKDRATVDAFHKAGVAAGGKSNGEPGIRAQYSPNYYAAFVLDPAGNNIEVLSIAAE